ncbi:hypothetical protein DFH08DRAFT_957549 [Mycena albidolilacea]|uniref:Uncharacterized protein n=1 Tax=Mycena albidolilacea TaxID=1033008 RepID=A0AAD7ETZ5_9AGAR|nr:hypothetical protein DFH08DRAFT_957549 [Mycena albidolilacea]
MPSSLHNFALAWNLGFRFFLDPSTSPRFLLDWDHHNADGTRLSLRYGMESFRTPRRFFHERSDTVSLEPYSGPAPGSRGVAGPEPVPHLDILFHYWLATSHYPPVGVLRVSFLQFLTQALTSPSRPSPTLPIFDFWAIIEDYPREWSLDTIAHQHFLACAWLGFWCIKERGPARWPIQICWLQRSAVVAPPPVFNKFLDRMVLAFENLMAEYRRAREDHVEEDALCKQLFKLVLNMEHTLFWMSRLSFWVVWSVHYNQLLEQLFPTVLSDFPSAQRQAEFNRLRACLFFSRNLSSTLLEDVVRHKPLGCSNGYCLPPPHPLGWFQLQCEVQVPTRPFLQRGFSTRRYREVFVQRSLGISAQSSAELVSLDGHQVPTEEHASPGCFLLTFYLQESAGPKKRKQKSRSIVNIAADHTEICELAFDHLRKELTHCTPFPVATGRRRATAPQAAPAVLVPDPAIPGAAETVH